MKLKTVLTLAAASLLAASVAVVAVQDPEEEDGNQWSPELRARIRARQSPIPLQAAVCDTIGIGRVASVSTNRWDEIVRFDDIQYWIGDPGSNTLSVIAGFSGLVVTNTPVVFFATRYALPSGFHSAGEPRFYLLFRMPEWRQRLQAVDPQLYDNDRSWFYATSENADLMAYASNLVEAAQISTNRLHYYQQIRDGVRLHPAESRIHIDSDVSFVNCRYWMPTNFMLEVWSDPLLPAVPRADVNNNHKIVTDLWLP
ncbi:MAG: hypothetical protein ACOX9C_10485 [Kiritimatiellia bacterium]|jgi:hypothetical protein